MAVSRRFFVAIPCGLLAAFALYLSLCWMQLGVPTVNTRWCFTINEKKHAIAEAIPGPRLLIVGGSSVHFGISARLIQEQTGIPTVNLGTHAALGPRYILDLARNVLRPGDNVLLVMEYELFGSSGEWRDPLLMEYLVARDPARFKLLPLSEQFEVAMEMPLNRIKRGLRNRGKPEKESGLQPVYDSRRVNSQGDQVDHLAILRQTNSPVIVRPVQPLIHGLPPGDACFQPVAEFCAWARTNGIRVLATFPNVVYRAEYELPPALSAIERINRFYSGNKVPVLEPARSVMYPPDLFLDTAYHLVEEAQLERTRHLIAALKPAWNDGTTPRSSP